jgi:hypothetical protein
MKVSELIEKLQALDPDLRVVVDGYEGGVKDASYVTVEEIALNVNEEWYYGEHETTYADEKHNAKYKGHERVQAVHIC